MDLRFRRLAIGARRTSLLPGSVRAVALSAVVMLLPAAGLGAAGSQRPRASAAARSGAESAGSRSRAASPAAFPLTRSLTPGELAGERIIASYSGPNPPASLISEIRSGSVSGVIFFAANISSQTQIRRVASELQADAAHSPVRLPLLLMTDQEGGEVRRLPGAPALSEKQIGESRNPEAAAAQAGRGAGLNLRGAGLNVNLAPVLDVYRQAGNFIDQYGRSYGQNPRTVATLGASFIRSQQRTGVAATAKHFPGLGAASTSEDTDLQPVTLDLSVRALRTIDELPYRSAIAAGVRLVMVSWARYPALDPNRPAGLSSRIVQGELRGRLGFRGVTITDALEAGALRAYGTTANRAVLAAGAGMDLLLCAEQNPAQAMAARQALQDSLRSGRLPRPAFLASVQRIIALRQSLERR
jgi:beta-N-acetylhexosaminidase